MAKKAKEYRRFEKVYTFHPFGWTIRISKDKAGWRYKKVNTKAKVVQERLAI